MTDDVELKTVVLLPTFNERRAVSQAIDGIFANVPTADIAVIDDSSPDGTAGVVSEHPRFGDGLELLVREERTGLADAYRYGMVWALDAGYERIVQMDADGSHQATELPRLLAACGTADTLVIGSRWLPGGRVENWSLFRRLLSRGGNRFARAALSCDIPDMTSGYRVWGRAALSTTLAAGNTGLLGYGFLIEMAWSHWVRGGQVKPTPICFIERTSGRSKMSTGITFEAALGVMRLRQKEFPPNSAQR